MEDEDDQAGDEQPTGPPSPELEEIERRSRAMAEGYKHLFGR